MHTKIVFVSVYIRNFVSTIPARDLDCMRLKYHLILPEIRTEYSTNAIVTTN